MTWSTETDSDSTAVLKESLLKLRELRAKNDKLEREKFEPIAIIGMSCRLPGGANSPEAFWQVLREGKDCIREVPADRWDIERYYDSEPQTAGKMYTRWGGFLDDIRGFDRAFFGISPREAASLDPQHRLLLELAWEALERAGVPTDSLSETAVGVFVGIMSNDYSTLQVGDLPGLDEYFASGNLFSFVSGRLSYLLGCEGPSIAIDTACSSSLVAVHLAATSLRQRECDLALIGGCNAILAPHGTVLSSQIRSQAPDGRCKTFDAEANGYVRGEGCGVIVCKRLSDALAAGDEILALVRGSAVNHGGASGGLTVPNGRAQEQVIRKALLQGKVEPSQISYVEAHGTGTPLGDPIEARAIASALREKRDPGAVLTVGSVKTNIGHLEAAAGIAGLIKVVLALEHQEIPAHLHYANANPYLAWRDLRVQIPSQAVPWPRGEQSRLAGVSSFGLSGTNAHVVLEEAPRSAGGAPEPATTPAASRHLLPVSARSQGALVALASLYAERLEGDVQNREQVLDFCYAAGARRAHHSFRLAATGDTAGDLAAALRSYSEGREDPRLHGGREIAASAKKVVFVCPGQGSQWLGMGRELYQSEPAFRDAIDRCQLAFEPYVNFRLSEIVTGEAGADWLERIDVVQPTLFAFGVALAALLREWNVVPDALIGHSMGEVTAAHIAGALPLATAAKIICVRSRLLLGTRQRGAMLLVDLPPERAGEIISGDAEIAIGVVNSARSTVLSGDRAALTRVSDELTAAGTFCRFIKVDVASHSPQMDPILGRLESELGTLLQGELVVPLVSTVTGGWALTGQFDNPYWRNNLRQPVRFGAAVQHLLAEDHSIFVELSPHPILLPAVQQNLQEASSSGKAFASVTRDGDERADLVELLAELYTEGQPVDFAKAWPRARGHVRLPTYPWQREPTWFPESQSYVLARGVPQAARHPWLMQKFEPGVRAGELYWQLGLSLREFDFLRDHRVFGNVIVPGASYLELAMAGLREDLAGARLTDVTFERPLFLVEDSTVELQLALLREDARGGRFEIAARTGLNRPWQRHAHGSFRGEESSFEAPASAEGLALLASVMEGGGRRIAGQEHYAQMAELGLDYEQRFQSVQQLWVDGDRVVGEVRLAPRLLAQAKSYVVHPTVIDGCLQLLAGVVGLDSAAAREPHLPVFAQDYWVTSEPIDLGQSLFCHLQRLEATSDGVLRADVQLMERSGRLLMRLGGLEAKSLALTERAPAEPIESWAYRSTWEPRPLGANSSQERLGSWLIVGSEACNASCAEVLEAAGARVTRVVDATAYRRASPSAFEVPLQDADAIERLLRELAHSQRSPQHVLYAGALELPALDAQRRPSVDDAMRLACLVPLRFAQALARVETGDVRLWLLTRHAQQLQPSEAVNAAGAPLWGFSRSLCFECPALRPTIIDFGAQSLPRCAEIIAAEASQSEWEAQIAWREDQRQVCRLDRASDVESVSRPLTSFCARPDRTYVISGGLGALGLSAVQWLFGVGARHFLLLGRGGPAGEAAELVDELRRRGADVRTARVDVADYEQLAEALRPLGRELPPCGGCLHAAGVLADGTIDTLDADKIERVFAPKVRGALNLEQLLSESPLEFFVYYSSVAALLGSPGQSNYAAANACLDALAGARRARGLPGLSIGWGPFAEKGLAAVADRADRLDRKGILSFTMAQSALILQHLLSGDRPAMLGMLRLDERRWQESFPLIARLSVFERIRSSSDDASSPAAAAAEVQLALQQASCRQDRRTLVVGILIREVRAALRLAEGVLSDSSVLLSLGLDSLRGLELRGRLEASFGLSLPATLLWTKPDVGRLAEYLLERLGWAGADAGDHFAQVDLEGESVLAQEIVPEHAVAQPPEQSGRVLLTGATGFLGAYLASELLQQSDAMVCCLVRAPSAQEALRRVVDNLKKYGLWSERYRSRLTGIPGDLGEPRFGLTQERFEGLSRYVGSIVHSAAMYNWVYPYQLHRGANVLGTHEVLRLACLGAPKHLHHISSLGIFAALDIGADRIVRETDALSSCSQHFMGYLQSKWVSERIVTLARDRGLPVTIYRPPLITGDTTSGACKVEQDFFCHMIKGCIQLGLAPPDHRGIMTLYPVDYLARGIVRLSQAPDASGRVFHFALPFNFSLICSVAQKLGYPLQQVPYADWFRSLAATGEENALDRFKFMFGERLPASAAGQAGTLFEDLCYSRRVRFHSDQTAIRLERDGLLSPPANESLFKEYIQYFERTGFLDLTEARSNHASPTPSSSL